MSTPVRGKIDFVDLAAQQARIGPAIDAAIKRVLAHGGYIMGPEVAELEKRLAEFSGARFAITCSSGTDALALVLMAKGVKPGDAVICPALTFCATAEVVALLGATPVFADVEAGTFNIDPAGIESAIQAAHAANLNPVGIIPVDLFGLPANYTAIHAIAEQRDLWVLADAAQSFGGAVNGRRVGTLAAITATSFFPAKPLGCYGDGGAIFTDDETTAATLKSLRVHGQGSSKYDTVRIGLAGRLDTIQAAILIEKLVIFADEIARRQQVADRYTNALSGLCETPKVPTGVQSAWAQYTLRVDARVRDAVRTALDKQGIPTMIYYPLPLHAQAAYLHFPRAGTGLAISERLCREVLSLPMHPYLEAGTQDYIIAEARRALG